MNSVPFSIQILGGWGQCEGLLREEDRGLTLEFQSKDAVAGLLKTGVKRVHVPLKDLVSVTLSKGWLGGRWLGVTLVLQAARLETLQEVPGMSQGKVELRIAAKDRAAAELLVENLHEEDTGAA